MMNRSGLRELVLTWRSGLSDEWAERMVYRFELWTPEAGCRRSLITLAILFAVAILSVRLSGHGGFLIFSFCCLMALGTPAWWLLRLANVERRKPFEMVCELRTIPGMIGGEFKADIEAITPEELAGFTLTLQQLTGRRHAPVQRIVTVDLPIAAVKLGNGSYRFPVRLQVPVDQDVPNRPWSLVVTARCADRRIDYTAFFPVPMKRAGAAEA